MRMLIWSSRLLLIWSGAEHGAFACFATLLAPVIAEVVWVAWLGWRSAPGHVVLLGRAAIASPVLLLGRGMAAMSSDRSSCADDRRASEPP